LTDFANNEWNKANKSLVAAKTLIEIDPDSSVSRAYYAAFHAVTALFALDGKAFTKHTALRAAVHRELVKEGKWHKDLGTDYDYLLELREIGDYGGMTAVTMSDAQKAVKCAKNILDGVIGLRPEIKR
jgi:uncharacterized protein (UPF0332 family)